MLARVLRSGVTESVHEGAIAVTDPNGTLIASYGDIDRKFFARSSIKPFQATVSQEAGADLPPEWLAVACASHVGTPIHVATVRAMLADAALTESDLATPADWPRGRNRDRLVSVPGSVPRAVYHNCSGKHAAFLRAANASGWDLVTYLDPSHPLQTRVRDLLSEVSGSEEMKIGVDGCGAPTFTVSTASLAGAFSCLGNSERFGEVFQSMHRFPRLISGGGMTDAEIAVTVWGLAKRGAEGNFAMTMKGRGSVAVKVFDGSSRAIGPVVTSVLDQLGWLPPSMLETVRRVTRITMSGGGKVVGTVEPAFRLNRT